MKISEFLKAKLLYIIFFLLALFCIWGVLNVHDIPGYSIFYVLVITGIAFVVPLTVEFIRKRSFYENLRKISLQLDRKFLLSEMLERPDFFEGILMFDTLKDCNKSMNDEIARYRIATTDYREYIEKWVHDIKTPIAACKLAIDNHPERYGEAMAEDIEKIDNYVMQTLFYARTSNVEKDYIIKEKSLNEIVSNSIRANSRQLIRAGFTIERNSLDTTVMTDEKWVGFILDQIISNSIKYKGENPKLIFTGEKCNNSVRLSIEDNGIGIAPCDISRIFEKNFTGGNGRLNKKSTGFGLYICKKLCTKLGIEISACSDKGTAIILDFPKSAAEIMK